MKTLLLLIPVLLCATGGTSQTIRAAEFSHIALLGWRNANGGIQFNCGGSYIGKNLILAGGHCVTRFSRPPDFVRLGAGVGNGRDFRVTNHTLHYRFKPQFDYHNMAIFHLDANPAQTMTGVKAPCILYPHLQKGRVQLIGQDDNGSLLKTNLDVMDTSKCHEYYNPTQKLRFGVLLCCFCARNVDETKCTNLHSSPLQVVVQRNGKQVPFLVGHKSIGKSCGVKSPAIYTRYGSYFEWIETITGIKFDEAECFNRY